MENKKWVTGQSMRRKAMASCVLTVLLFLSGLTWAGSAPPVFDPVGDERVLNSNLWVVEGNPITFTVIARDPDGDALTYSAQNLPSWAIFNSATRTLSGTAPLYSSTYATRLGQQGIYDVTITASDGAYTAKKVISINVLDSLWTPQTMAQLVANRPITSGGAIGTPVGASDLTITEDTTVSNYGKAVRRIRFDFRSQVPVSVASMIGPNDWVTTGNYAFLPMSVPTASNVGALVEGRYAGYVYGDTWGEREFGERACAELNIPVAVVNNNWNPDYTTADYMPHIYTDMQAVNERLPRYMWAAFSTAHHLRAADALATIVRDNTTWAVDIPTFKVVYTGHSKFGFTCWAMAAAAPSRMAGFMSSGWEFVDHDAYRLLAREQGAANDQIQTVGRQTYLGVMMKYYEEPFRHLSEMSPNTRAFMSGTTNDFRGVTSGYFAKYSITASEKVLPIPHRVGYVPNQPHTTRTSQHSTFWRMWLAYCLLGRPISSIDSLRHYPASGNVTVEAKISGSPTIHQVRVYFTNQSDLNTSSWNGFTSSAMSLGGGIYSAQIPSTSTAYYVEVKDTANSVAGIVCSPPVPVNRNYPFLITITTTGDINGDGVVNVLDVQLCVNVVLGIETDAERVKKANVNGDGNVDVLDIQEIVNEILGG